MGVPPELDGFWKRENPTKIRMMTGGTPILGNHHIWKYMMYSYFNDGNLILRDYGNTIYI